MPGSGAVRGFLDHHYLHYNARETVAAARAYEAHVDAGGKMFVTLAGAMSTARVGRILSRMIRAGKVHGICCTGANLEEDLFTLLAGNEYEPLPDWRALSAQDEARLAERGMNRVTDTAIPETVMRHVEGRLRAVWKRALESEERFFPFEFFYEVLDQPDLAEHFQLPAEDSWVFAAKEMGIPIYTPGWEDSTIGNIFTAWAMEAGVFNHHALRTGTEQLAHLARWYRTACGLPEQGKRDEPAEGAVVKHLPGAGVGFFQIGGGIAGDFPICVVPMMRQDLKWHDTPMWSYFCQISDAVTSYGGYSGAVPNEKITWGKLDVETPKFMIQSDATIVAPLVFAYVLGD
ncbi:MAG: deoxyhypusine synthase family protein [Planctomycetota bacterium]